MQDQLAYHHQIISAQFPEQERLACPRCESTNTKFCYYNNYNLSQPRHYCKSCRRYWTKGGALRNIPVGGGTRKHTKRSSNSKRPNLDPKTGNSLPDGGKDMTYGNSGSGHDPTQRSSDKPDSVVGSKGLNGNGPGELEPNGLRMKAVDHGKDLDPGSGAGRVSNYRFDSFGSDFGLCEGMDNCNVTKGEKASGLGLGVGMAQVGDGVDTSRVSDIGSGHKLGHKGFGVKYLSMQGGDPSGPWSNGSNRWTDLAIYNTHDRAFD